MACARLVGGVGGWVLGVVVALLVAAVWGVLLSPRRRVAAPVAVRVAVELVLFVAAGSNLTFIWICIALLAVFSFVESPQLQALLADIARPALRDASFSVYFTLAFGIGAMWTAIYGVITGTLGDDQGLPVVFLVMALAYLAAACTVLPIRAEQRTAQARAEELALAQPRSTDQPG